MLSFGQEEEEEEEGFEERISNEAFERSLLLLLLLLSSSSFFVPFLGGWEWEKREGRREQQLDQKRLEKGEKKN